MLWAVSPDRTVCLTGSSPCCILGDKEGALSKANVAISSMAPVEDKISPVGIASISPSLRRAYNAQVGIGSAFWGVYGVRAAAIL